MSVEHFGAFLVAITILTLTPGLDTALVIRNTTRGGFKDGFVSSVGICSGLFVHATFSAIGISAILMQSAELFHAVKWVGAIYLIWLGVNSLRATLANNQSLAVGKAGVGSVGVKRAFREGFLSNVLNPKTAVFYLRLFATVYRSARLCHYSVAIFSRNSFCYCDDLAMLSCGGSWLRHYAAEEFYLYALDGRDDWSYFSFVGSCFNA